MVGGAAAGGRGGVVCVGRGAVAGVVVGAVVVPGVGMTMVLVVGAAVGPPMAEGADGLPSGTAPKVAAVFVARSVSVLVSLPGAGSGVPFAVLSPSAPGSGISRTRLSAPAARTRPPAASRTLRGRGRRCRPREPKR
ncbi:hypothetical protein AQJ91_07450 [Streptomyces dysideae]|uniref:Uncharacterized protein n=1 Tax=Streptomyces dysideae TaxID=909626 RepID=A0A101V319_9ACTN|nr:hypothetical protein AQJ91_07450 [Streptomyces dysideae]